MFGRSEPSSKYCATKDCHKNQIRIAPWCLTCITCAYLSLLYMYTIKIPSQPTCQNKKSSTCPVYPFFMIFLAWHEAIGSLRCNMPRHPKEIPCFQDAFSQGCSSASAADKRSSGSTSSRARKSPAPHELIINTHQWYSMDMQWYQYSIPKHCQNKLLLTLSCRNLWQNQLGKFWCGLTGWQLTLLGLKSAEDHRVRRKKQVAITRISECLKVKRSELVSFSHCSKADLSSINFEPSLWIASSQPSS